MKATFEKKSEALKEYGKHKSPKRIIYSPHSDNKNGAFFLETDKDTTSMVRNFETIIKET